ncbi:MAG: BatA domain-containing protein, partial [Planctomycetaceae bacterium]|nr:BatA domain-containing protein [Planctomycetaceae bacterium]
MSFIQIGFLGALAALAVPIIIHLVFRQRAKKVELGTLRFLRVVLEHNARRRRVMRWLLLMLRLACVGLLAFLFARPYLLALRAAGEKQSVVVLIDQSATMELAQQDGTRSIERAVATVRDLVSKAGNNSRFEIAFFDHAIHPLFAPVLDTDKDKSKPRDPGRNELLTKLVAPQACHGGTDYGVALEWARDTLAKAPPGPRVLHVLTDLQQSGLAWSEVDELPDDVTTHLHDLGRSAVSNLAVTEARPERAWLRPDEQTSLHVTVYNGSPFTAIDLPVVLKLAASGSAAGRQITLREQMKIEPGTLESKRFDLPPLADGLWQGTVSIETEDDLPADNARHVALLASRPYQVLLIDGRASASPVLSSTYFFESALRLAPAGELYSASPFEPRTIEPGDRLPDLDAVDVVVLSDVSEL